MIRMDDQPSGWNHHKIYRTSKGLSGISKNKRKLVFWMKANWLESLVCLHSVARRALEIAQMKDDGPLFYLILVNRPGQEEASTSIHICALTLAVLNLRRGRWDEQEALSVMRMMSCTTLSESCWYDHEHHRKIWDNVSCFCNEMRGVKYYWSCCSCVMCTSVGFVMRTDCFVTGSEFANSVCVKLLSLMSAQVNGVFILSQWLNKLALSEIQCGTTGSFNMRDELTIADCLLVSFCLCSLWWNRSVLDYSFWIGVANLKNPLLAVSALVLSILLCDAITIWRSSLWLNKFFFWLFLSEDLMKHPNLQSSKWGYSCRFLALLDFLY